LNNIQCSLGIEGITNLFEVMNSIYRIDSSEFIALDLSEKNRDGFEILIGIILSQNTSDRNAMKAFSRLKQVVGGNITPDKILRLDLETIINAIKIAGISNRKAKTILNIAKFLSQNKEFFDVLRKMESEEIRKTLLEFSGIGPKTADVFILMYYNKPTFPIDTHIRRVLVRLGYFKVSDNYENIRRSVVNALNNDVEKLKKLHILLIHHGRMVCRAQKPQCLQCVLNNICCFKIHKMEIQ